MPSGKSSLLRQLAASAKLLHELCFDEIELDAANLRYEPRSSDQCASCAALWIASKRGEVMRIDVAANPTGEISRRSPPPQSWFHGNRTARAIHHVHDGTGLGGGSYLLVGRDGGMLDIFVDPPAGDDDRPLARLHLHRRWKEQGSAWCDVAGLGASDGEPRATPDEYALGITAVSTFRTTSERDALYILVATRNARLYVIEARSGRLCLREPQSMPGWIEWIVAPDEVDRDASREDDAPGPDVRTACISRAGHIVRFSHDDLLSGLPGWRTQLPLIPTAAMPFGRDGLLLGTTTGLFLVRARRSRDRATAIPVTRSPVLCLDRATIGDDGSRIEYVTMGLEDGQLRVVDARLLRELAGIEVAGAERAAAKRGRTKRVDQQPDHDPSSHSYHRFAKPLDSAVLVVETLRPAGTATDSVYVLAATRDHAVRLFRATSQETQHTHFVALWREYITELGRKGVARSMAAMLDVELEAARRRPARNCDERVWCHAMVTVVLPRLAAACERVATPTAAAKRENRNRLVALACELASRADRQTLYQLSGQIGALCDYEIDPLLQISRALLGAVPITDSTEWKRFIAGHLRDLNALANPDRVTSPFLVRLIAWTRFVRKYALLGHTFASKQTELRELVEHNYATRKYLDALIYQARLCHQQHDIRWTTKPEHHARENIAALHTVACDARCTVAVVVTGDGRLAVFDTASGDRLSIHVKRGDARAAKRRRSERRSERRAARAVMPSGALGTARISDPGGRLRDIATGCLYKHDRWPNTVTALTVGLDDSGRVREIAFRFRSWSEHGRWHDYSGLYSGTRDGRLRWIAGDADQPARSSRAINQ